MPFRGGTAQQFYFGTSFYFFCVGAGHDILLRLLAI